MKITHFCLVIALGSFAQVRGQQPVVGVPFEFLRNEIIVQVKVNGKGPFNMMLDTGTDPIRGRSRHRERIGLEREF